MSLLIFTLSLACFLDFSLNVVDGTDFTELDAAIATRVQNLLNTGKYNLSYFTDYEKGAGNLFDTSENSMVASTDVRCSRVGSYYLEIGGNAIDAAVAAAICLNVIEMASTGFTGGGVALSHFNGRTEGLDFRAYQTKTIVYDENIYGGGTARSFQIPGMAMGLYKLWQQGGEIEWSKLFDIPILIAYKGFKIKPSLNKILKEKAFILSLNPFLKEILFDGDTIKYTGRPIVNKPLARTLQLLSMDHKNMYEGTIPSIMMNQIGQKYYTDLMTEIAGYHTKTIKTLNLDLNENKRMITLGENSGGPLAAYIINAIRGLKRSNPGIFFSDGSVDPRYYLNLYDILNNAQILAPELRGVNGRQLIIDAFNNYTTISKKLLADSKRCINVKKSLISKNYEEENEGSSASLTVVDKCGNGVSMQTDIIDFFGAKLSFPSLGLVENTYTTVKIDENNVSTSPYFTRSISYATPVLVVDKTYGQLYDLFSGTGERKSPSAVAQLMINYFFRRKGLSQALTEFRMFSIYDNNRIYSEYVQPIPDDIVNLVKTTKGVDMIIIPFVSSSSVQAIGIKRDVYGWKTSVFGMGDFRRNGGVKGL